MTAYQLVSQTYGNGTNRKLPISEIGSYLFTGDDIIDTDEDLSKYVGASLLKTLTAAQVTAAGGADQTVTPIADAAASSENVLLRVAADDPVAITHKVNTIVLLSSTTGAKAMTVTSANPGQQIDIVLKARTGGSYTLASVDGSTLTFDLAAEYARIVRNAADDGWDMLLLSGATLV